MSTVTLIPANDFCTWHQVEYTFISSLHDAGLVEIRVIDKAEYIPQAELQKLEKMIRLHRDLEINVAGIEAITHLLERVDQMHEEMRVMRNRLMRYGEDK